tara:strand:+ start:901 stop:1218 length:318 start_codon:yes stop_codon:yes gene_type:complete
MTILGDFIQLVDSDDKKVDILDLFENKDEQLRWEKLVEVFDTIQIDNISSGLHEVAEKYRLTRDEEITILAYVKFLELMVMKMKLVQDIDQKTQKKNETPNRMYG